MLMLIPWFQLTTFHVPVPFSQIAIPLQPFGLFAAAAIMFGARVAEARAQASGATPEMVRRLIATTVPIGIASAMLLNVAFYEPAELTVMAQAVRSWFSAGPSIAFPYPGLSSYGGFIGGTLAGVIFCRRRKLALLPLADVICFALPFAWILARSGCFVVHDHPGIVTDFFLAVDDFGHSGSARHDLALYEILWSLAMSGLLIALGRQPRPTGFFTAFVSLSYACVRFALDCLRALPNEGGDVRYLGFTPAQYGSLVLLVVGLGVGLRVSSLRARAVWLPRSG